MQSERRVVSKRRRQVLAVLSFILGFAASAQAHGRAAAAMATAASDPAIIQSPDPQSFGSFGGAVALSADGQTALVGALDQNRAYVFVRNGDGWDLDARLPAAGPAAGAFGRVVALSADKTVAVVAATFEAACVNGLQCGAVYIYVRTSGGWLQKAHLIPPYAVDFDLEFGSALALSADGSILLVGRPEDSCISQPCLGAVFAYERAGDTWTLVDTLRGSNPQVQAFGAYISLSPDGNTALIGAPTTPCAAGPDCGEAYVFTHVGGTWSESAKLTPFLPQAEEFFGGSVGLSADGLSALIGVSRSPATGSSSAVQAFLQTGGAWTEFQEIGGSGPETEFGRFLSLSSDGLTALVGAPTTGCAAGAECGAVYRMARTEGGRWSSPQSLTAFPAGALGGFTVALSGDGVNGLAGAPGISCAAGANCGGFYSFSALSTAPSIPTLGASGRILLALLLAAGGSLVLVKRRRSGP